MAGGTLGGIPRYRYTAPAEGFSRGVEQGIGIYNSLFVDPEMQKAKLEGLQTETAARKQKMEDDAEAAARNRDYEALKLVDEDSEQLGRETLQQQQHYGGAQFVPQDQIHVMAQRHAELARRRAAITDSMRARYQKWQTDGRATAQAWQDGREDPTQAKDTDIVNAVASNTMMDPKSFILDPQTGKTPFDTWHEQLAAAQQSHAPEKGLPALNAMLQGELAQGVGSWDSADGTRITRKEIVALVPAQNPDGTPSTHDYYPVLKVYTQGHPNGYTAPVTQDRMPGGQPATLNIDRMLERLEQMSSVNEGLKHPEIQDKMVSGTKKIGDELARDMAIYSSIGPKKTAGVGMERVPLGGTTMTETYDRDTGDVINRRYDVHTQDPNRLTLADQEELAKYRAGLRPEKPTSFEEHRAYLAGQVKAGKITQQQMDEALMGQASGQHGTPPGQKPLSETEIANEKHEAMEAWANSNTNLRKNKDGTYSEYLPVTDGKGKPRIDPKTGKQKMMWQDARPETMNAMTKAGLDRVKELRAQNESIRNPVKPAAAAPAKGGIDTGGGIQAGKPAAAAKPDVAALRQQAKDAIDKGAPRDAVAAEFKRLTNGQDY
jgi:hypothetical protein